MNLNLLLCVDIGIDNFYLKKKVFNAQNLGRKEFIIKTIIAMNAIQILPWIKSVNEVGFNNFLLLPSLK